MKLKLIFNQKNLGDRISEFIFRQLGCDDIELVDMANQCSEENIVSVGSVMNFVDNHSIVWGAGFIGRNSSLGGDSFDFSNQLIKIPKEIKLVRGRYTDLKLSEMGLPMIKKYGDPVLLLPLLIKPVVNIIEGHIGILPHYVDEDCHTVTKLLKKYNGEFLCIRDDYNVLINGICRCEYLITSTLHGLVLGIAYKRKVIPVRLGNKILGGDFKFLDFLSGLDIKIDKLCDIDNLGILEIDYNIVKRNCINMINTIPVDVDKEKLIERINEYY